MGPVFLATSGHNEQYNSRLAAVRPMPGIGVERLPQVEFRPDFDYVKERTSDDLMAAVPPGGRFSSSYKTLGRVEFNHFFLDGIRGKAVTFEPPTGLGKEERRVTLICRLSFKLSVLLNAPIGSPREEFNVDMIKEEIEVCWRRRNLSSKFQPSMCISAAQRRRVLAYPQIWKEEIDPQGGHRRRGPVPHARQGRVRAPSQGLPEEETTGASQRGRAGDC